MPLLLIALIIVPLAEIAVFIQIGGLIGLAATLLAVLGTAILGAILLRQQGLHTLHDAQTRINRNEIPIKELFDGICLFIAGAFLLTPGFLTDAIGFLLLIPPVRSWTALRVWRSLEARGSIRTHGAGPGGHPRRPGGRDGGRDHEGAQIIDAEFEEVPVDAGDDGDGEVGGPRRDSPWGTGAKDGKNGKGSGSDRVV